MSKPWDNAKPEDWEKLKRQVILPPGNGGGGGGTPTPSGGICGLMVLVILLFAATGLLVSCAESSSEATAVVNPEDVQIDKEFTKAAQTALAVADTPQDGWRIGIVFVVEPEWPWALGVLTTDGILALEDASNCGDDWDMKPFLVIASPGDLITWSVEGDDNRVCADEIRLTEKAAAL